MAASTTTITTTPPTIHIVRKGAYNTHHFLPQPALPSLPASTACLRPHTLALSANTLAYCALGDMLGWFGIYPVPQDLPAPYNEGSEWGIPVAWGYAKVVESRVEGVEVGQELYGLWPAGDMVVDLRLERSEVEDHWVEVSEHRKGAMGLYQRYMVVGDGDETEKERYWRASLLVLWMSGYLLNRFVLGGAGGDGPNVGPLPGMVEWDDENADLREAVVVTLGSGSKTARGFLEQLVEGRGEGMGPVAVVEVTAGRVSVLEGRKVRFQRMVVGYEEVVGKGMVEWFNNVEAKKAVVVDFAGRGDVFPALCGLLREKVKGKEVLAIGVGAGPGVYSAEDMQEWLGRGAKFQAVSMSASPIIDGVMNQISEREFWPGLMEAWEKVLRNELDRSGGEKMLGLSLDVRKGTEGLEKAWDELCVGKATGETACVVNL